MTGFFLFKSTPPGTVISKNRQSSFSLDAPTVNKYTINER